MTEKIGKLKKKIENDIKVNERCILEEDLQHTTYQILKLWIEYDKELLEIINED